MKAQSPDTRLEDLRRRARRARVLGAVVGAVLTVLAGYVALFRMGDAIVTLSYDLPFLVHRADRAENIRIVYIDQAEGKRLDRSVQADLLDALNEAGAKAVVYDVLFTKPWPDPEVDEKFAAAIRSFRGVDEAGDALPGVPRRHVLMACGRETISKTAVRGERLIPPTDVLDDVVDDIGLVAFPRDREQIIRRLSTGNGDYPSIAWQAALALGGKVEKGSRLDPRWINYIGPPPGKGKLGSNPAIHSCFSSDVIGARDQSGNRPRNLSVDTEFFRDKIVVVGGLPGIAGKELGEDLFNTPFHRIGSGASLERLGGVDLQANVLSNLLKGNWLTRSSDRFDLYLVVAIGILAGLGCALLKPARAAMGAVVAVVVLILAGVLIMNFNRIWFPWTVGVLVQIPVALVLGVSTNFSVERWVSKSLVEQQRRLREAFALYLSPEMLDQLTKDEFMLKLRGRKAKVAMIMTDLATYTSMCERIRDPARIVETLQDYFQRVTEPIFKQSGMILHFAGDGLLAAWGTPIAEPHPDPAASINAVRAAWELSKINRMIVEGVEVQTRIGLNFGEVLAGNIGSEKHVAYSLTGDPVNLTARLEGLNKMLGTSILMSRDVHEHPEVGREFRTRRVGKFQVKGREEPTEVYELLGPMVEEREPEWITLYHEAHRALETGDHELARENFAAADAARAKLAAGPGGLAGDGASRYFLELLDKGDSMPDGVVALVDK